VISVLHDEAEELSEDAGLIARDDEAACDCLERRFHGHE
jgi:hypothetical protein